MYIYHSSSQEQGIPSVPFILGTLGVIVALSSGLGFIPAHADPACVDPPSGLMHWWPADANANDIKSGNDGTLTNGAAFAIGKVQQAFMFDGVDDYVDVPHHANLNVGTAYTVDFWFKANPTQSSPDNHITLIDKSHRSIEASPTWSGWVVQGRTDSNPGQISFLVGNGSTFLGPSTISNVFDDTWHHFVGVLDGSIVALYLDGVLQGTTPFTGTAVNNTDPLNIGRWAVRGSRNFHGLIDEVEIFDRALSPTEIQALFDAGSAGKCKNGCGNGVVEGSEQCDDGNVTDGDGCSVTCQNEVCTPPPSELVSWWTADGHSQDITDGNDGSFLGGAQYGAGRAGQAFALDGLDDLVLVPDAPNLHLSSSDFTVDAWVLFNKLTVIDGSPDIGDMSIVDKMDQSSGANRDGWRLLKQSNDRFLFCFGGDDVNGCTPDNPRTVLSTTVATTGIWYHIAARKQGTEIALFVNGVKEASQSMSSFKDTNAVDLHIGARPGLFAHLNGFIDEVEIFNRALTDAEIQAIFDARAAGKCKELQIVTDTLPANTLGEFSSHTLEARFGVPPYTWSHINGTLPTGMTFSTGGVLSGVPTDAGAFTFTVKVTDNDGNTAEKTFEKEVLLALPPPDLRINVIGTEAVPGRVLDNFVVVENVGNTVATNVPIFGPLDPALTLTEVDPPGVADLSDLVGASVVHWNIPTLDPGEKTILRFRAELDPEAPLGEKLSVGPICYDLDALRQYSQCLLAAVQAVSQCSRCVSTCQPCGGLCTLGPAICLPCLGICGTCLGKSGCLSAIITTVLECYRAAQEGNPFACDDDDKTISQPVDPNEKHVLAETFIQPDQSLVYPVHFENVSPDTDAQDIFLTDVLDTGLDLSTVEVLIPGTGFTVLPVDQSVLLLEEDKVRIIDVDGTPVEIPYTETWSVSLDSVTRTLRWELINVFLAPGETDNVVFSIKPLENLSTGTEIRNTADIQFEIFETITTNEVLNIIDDVAPTCTVNALPAEVSSTVFDVSWSGTDATGEIDSYTIFVAEDGGAFTEFTTTEEESMTFEGEPATTYAFLCIAVDTAGNSEVQSLVAEASTTTPDNRPPVAHCQNVTVSTDAAKCEATAASIDDNSSDPDGDDIALVQTPAAPYALGNTDVTLTVTDTKGSADSCNAVVTVIDDEAPTINCNAPATITRRDTPVSFIATAEDNCESSLQITDYHCFRINPFTKKVRKTRWCRASFSGASITIKRSGAVGNHVAWNVKAIDGSGNETVKKCTVAVERPKKRRRR